LLSGDDALEWLDPDLPEESIKRLIVPFDDRYMEAHTVPSIVKFAKKPTIL
jgi:hypothetical protein